MACFENNADNTDRRSGKDRREKNPPLFSKYLLTGQRATPRRTADRRRPQAVDRYSSNILVVIITILALSMLDALFTLFLVGNGAKEANPLMAYYLESGPLVFIFIKYLELICPSEYNPQTYDKKAGYKIDSESYPFFILYLHFNTIICSADASLSPSNRAVPSMF